MAQEVNHFFYFRMFKKNFKRLPHCETVAVFDVQIYVVCCFREELMGTSAMRMNFMHFVYFTPILFRSMNSLTK
jgi:hypothetical protein